MIANLLIDKRVNPEDMLIGDKNAILVAARSSGYGSDYTTKVTCPHCGENSTATFDLTEVSVTERPEGFAGVTREGSYYNVELPQSNVTVKVKLLTGKDEALMTRNNRMNKRAGISAEPTLTSQMRTFIIAVNGDSTPKNIAYFVDHMPARDSRFLRTIYKAITPNVDMTQLFECMHCGYNSELEVPFTTDFFWPNR
jgi:transcription elongation factor Elf1